MQLIDPPHQGKVAIRHRTWRIVNAATAEAGRLRLARDRQCMRAVDFLFPASYAFPIIAAAIWPIIMAGALVFPPIKVGMIETSATLRLTKPRTLRSFGPTTAIGSVPIFAVPTG